MTLREYLKDQTVQSLNFVLASVKAQDCFGFDLDRLSYNEVKTVIRILRKTDGIDSVKRVFEILFKEVDFYEMDVVDFFKTKRFIQDEFDKILERENKLLQSVSEDMGLFEMAGGKRLNEFGDVLPLDKLAKIYGGYPLKYGKKKYVEIIFLLRMNTVLSDVDTKFNQLKYKK